MNLGLKLLATEQVSLQPKKKMGKTKARAQTKCGCHSERSPVLAMAASAGHANAARLTTDRKGLGVGQTLCSAPK